MKLAATAESRDESPGRASSSRTATRLLLLSGIAAVGLYGLGDLISGLLYDGYSFRDQAISELSAFGSPVRPLMMSVILIHSVLIIAFGLGVWRAGERKSIRWAGLALMGAGVIGIPTHTVFAMSSRWMDVGFNDTMHIILSGMFSLLVFVAMALSAVAYRGWFRLYSIATLLILIGFGGAASVAIGGIEENITPWAGGFERINAYAYFAWLVVLALNIMARSPVGDMRESDTGVKPRWEHLGEASLPTQGDRDLDSKIVPIRERQPT
jgi:hypothetical membrane protein